MHDFMWALVEEQASDSTCQHQVKNKDSGQDIRMVESEAHDISRSVITWAFAQDDPWYVTMSRTNP